MVLSSMDDYPLHQTAEPIRHVATSDRNFYDRYYFNLHDRSGELFVIFGLGQYPNLCVQDAFVCCRRGDEHRVVRASRELGDRMDTTVGPFRVEVLEGLSRVRSVVEPNEHGIEMDVTFEAACPAVLEPRHFRRQFGRVTFDTSRFAQTGRWTGSLRVAGTSYDVTPDRWWGTRDRSWGVRPVGEPEPPGIRARGAAGYANGWLWNYVPMQFDDYSIVYMAEEDGSGARGLEEAVRVWADPARGVEHLGRPEHKHEFARGTRTIERSTIAFAGGVQVVATPLLPVFLGVGTGYGGDADWRHGMYQGELVVQGVCIDMRAEPQRFTGFVDALARFECAGDVGYGLFEYAVVGPNDRYGFTSFTDVAS